MPCDGAFPIAGDSRGEAEHALLRQWSRWIPSSVCSSPRILLGPYNTYLPTPTCCVSATLIVLLPTSVSKKDIPSPAKKLLVKSMDLDGDSPSPVKKTSKTSQGKPSTANRWKQAKLLAVRSTQVSPEKPSSSGGMDGIEQPSSGFVTPIKEQSEHASAKEMGHLRREVSALIRPGTFMGTIVVRLCPSVCPQPSPFMVRRIVRPGCRFPGAIAPQPHP